MAFQGEKAFWQRIESRTGIKNPDQQRDEERGVPGQTAFWQALGMKEPEDSIEERARRIRTERILAEHRNVGYQELKDNAGNGGNDFRGNDIEYQNFKTNLPTVAQERYAARETARERARLAAQRKEGELLRQREQNEDILGTSRKEERDSLDQQMLDLANAKVADEYAGSGKGGQFGVAITDHFFQDVMSGNSGDAMGQFYGAMLLRDENAMKGLTSEELRMLKKSAEKYADEYEKSGMLKLEEKRAKALRERRPQPEIDAIDKEIDQLEETVGQWRAGAQRMEWQANLSGRQEKIAGIEGTARSAADFDTVAAEYEGKAGDMDDLRLYSAWLSYGAQNGQTWEEFYASQNPKQSNQRSGGYTHTRKKANEILQGMMDDEATRARDEYEAAYMQYQRAEENYYAVPDGDFQKAQDDYLAADERLKEAEKQLRQSERASRETEEETRKSLKEYRRSDEAEGTETYSEKEIPEIGNKLEFYLANAEEDSDYGNLPDDVTTIMQYGKNNMWDRATEKQRQVYAYLLGTDEEKAEEYLQAIQVEWSREAMYEYISGVQNSWSEESGGTKALENVASVPANVLGNLFAGADTISGMITGDYNPYSQAQWGQQYAGAVRQLTTDDVYAAVGYDKNSGKEPNFLQKAAANGYNALMSAGDSAFGVMLLGKGYTATMGVGATAQKAQELYERGASDKEITIGALMAGSFETLFEYASLDLIIKMQDGQGLKNFLINALKSAGVEASEEVFTELANKAAEAIYFGSNSDTADRENQYIAAGLSPEEAKKKAIADAAIDVFWAGYGGLVSGGLFSMSGVPSVVAQETAKVSDTIQQNRQYRSDGKSIMKNQAGKELVQAAKDSGVKEQVRKLAKEKASGDYEKMTAWQRRKEEKLLGALYEKTLQAQEEQANKAVRDSFQKVAEDKVREAQEAEQSQDQKDTGTPKEAEQSQSQETKGTPQEDPKTAAEALTKAAYGEELTEAEKKTVEAVGGEALIEEIVNSREFREDAAAKAEDAARRMADTMAMTQDTSKQKEIVSRFAREKGMDEAAMLGSIRRSQDAYAFTSAWESAYEMGAGGIALRYAQKARANSYLTQAQIETAYNEGRKAAGYYEEAAEEGLVPDGGQWNDRAYSGGQVRTVESGAAAQGQSGQQGTGGGIAAAAEKITSIQLGLENGTENRNLRRVAEAAYSEDTKAAAKVAKDSGLVFVPFSGGAIETWETVNGNKIKVKSRGCVVNGTMYVRVDDNTFTAEQIARHEAAHEKINRGEIDVKAVKERILKRYSQEEIDAIIQLYASAYGDSGLTAAEVLEEIVCDSMGRMNAFATDATERVAGEVGVFLRNVRKAAKNTGATKNTTGNGGGKYSLENQRIPTWEELEAKPPIKVVDISKAETSGTFSERRKKILVKAEEIIKKPYLNKDTNTLIFLTKQSYTHGFSNKGGIKLNAAEHITELIENSVLTYVEPPMHGSDYADRVYTFFAATNVNENIYPVKLKVKEYRNVGQQLPENISTYLQGNQEKYASTYDFVVLGLQTIEEGLPGSAEPLTDESASMQRPNKPSEIMVADLLNLVKGDAAKYIPEHDRSDIRYSREMDTVKALERQNKLLQEQRDYWKDQTRLTKTAKADKDAVRKLGRELIREYSSGIKVDEILTDLQWLADDAVGNGKASYQELTDAAEKIARKVLEGSGVDLNGDLAEIRKALKQYLRSTPINITESIKAGIPDFADFKKRNRALHFREDGSGTDVEAMWLELQDQFGTGMFPENISNPEDQVRYIAEELEDIREVMVNPYGKEMELAVQQLTYDILYRTSAETQQMKPTKADQAVERATKEMQRLLAEGRRRENARIENAQKTSIRQQIRTISDKFQRMATRPGKGISQHAPEGLRKAVVDFCGVFTESELRRMDRWQRNLEYRADELGRKASNVDVATGVVAEAEAIRDAQARRDRMTARLTEMQNAYEAMKKDAQYQTTYDETVAEMIKNLSEILDGKDLYQLETGDLRRVQQTMSAIYYTITNANKAFSMGKDKSIIDMATKMAKEIRQTNPKQAGMMVAGRRFMQWQMSPDTFFNYICGFIKDNEGKVIQKGFRQGAERMMGVQREFYQMFRAFTESKDKAVAKELNQLMNYSGKRMVNWGLKDLEGNEVKTTRGMMLQAYMMLNQKDSFESLQYGGFSIPNADRYYKGDVSGAYGDGLETTMLSESIGAGYTEMIQRNKDLRSRIEELQQKIEISETESYKIRYQQEITELEKQIKENQQKMEAITNAAAERLYNLQNAIEKQLTPLEKQLIEKAHEWYSYSGKLMADVFEQMYGFRPNLVENYVPIHRDPTTIKTDIRDMAGAEKAFNLENSGFTIDRVKNSQPILLTDFFQELNSQSEKMARYVGFAQVQKDFGKIWKTRIDSSGMTVNTLVRARFGAGKTNLGVSGEEYINHYIADVAGGHSSDDVLGKFYGNYAAATLRLNPRVAISQAASIPTAASVVGWKSMAAGFAKGLPKAMNTEYRNGLAEKNVWFYQRYKGQGGSTELAEIRQKGNVIERVANSRVGKKLFNWCQAVDVFSTGSIMWSAAEDYVKNQGIAKGSAEYEAAVNQVYTDIIRKSQPNYTTTERSDLLRDKRSHMKLLTMFKTQSNQNLNLLLEANGEFMRMRQDLKNGRNGVTEADVKAAGKKLANASTGVLLGGTVAFVGLRTIMNFILGAVYPYRDDETDEVTLESTLAGIGKEILSSLFGMVALGGQVYDILMPLITGDKYYGLSDSAVSSLSSMLENTITVIQKGKDTTGTQMWKMVNSWCMGFAIPAGNAKKIYDMIAMYTRDIQNGTFGQFTSDKTTKSKYQARVVEHYLKGEEEKAADALAMLFAKSSADTDDEAKKEIASGMRSYLKDLYIAAEISDVETEKIMEYTGTDDPASYTAKWDFQLAYPEINASDALVKAYGEKGNISDEVFLDAWEFAKNAEANKDKNGKTINGSKKQKIVDYVQAIPGLTKSQRKKLFELLDAGSVKGTPWE